MAKTKAGTQSKTKWFVIGGVIVVLGVFAVLGNTGVVNFFPVS